MENSEVSEVSAPFRQPRPTKIHLANPPLASVLTQARFPQLTAAQTPSWAERLAMALAPNYPEMNDGNEMSVTIAPDGQVQQTQAGNVKQFHTKDRAWHLSVAPNFITLQSTAYPGRVEFMERFEAVLRVFIGIAQPTRVERLGFRYTNRVVPVPVETLAGWIRPEFLGPINGAPAVAGPRLVHALSQAIFSFDNPGTSNQVQDGMQVQWGILPAGAVLDPAITPTPAGEPAWILDLDAFRHFPNTVFDLAAVLNNTQEMASRAYDYFRWIVTDAFLDHYGAER
ncbi:MAG: TIGR04255 family protein [Propionibacteriaceae bacterium]|jgi:uncharacterized protein (TIGR04255 family)|nr:TIGR04255 family protein [Propionibacteriaceae bacterium]